MAQFIELRHFCGAIARMISIVDRFIRWTVTNTLKIIALRPEILTSKHFLEKSSMTRLNVRSG